VNREGAEVTSTGRAFQTRSPATEKARRPTAGSLTSYVRLPHWPLNWNCHPSIGYFWIWQHSPF